MLVYLQPKLLLIFFTPNWITDNVSKQLVLHGILIVQHFCTHVDFGLQKCYLTVNLE